MTTGSSGAVFFLGTRAHYQVLQQPTRSYDVENGNASTETIYQNPSVQELWSKDHVNVQNNENESVRNCLDAGHNNWNYCEQDQITVTEEKEKIDNCGLKLHSNRRQSETALCERDVDMKPAQLNSLGEKESETPKTKTRRRISLLTFLASLARRKRRLDTDQMQYLQHIESALTTCTYRESCRCFECQSRYFECDESDEDSDENEYYTSSYVASPVADRHEHGSADSSDHDEVFEEPGPGDNTSTDLLIENREKMSVSSDDVPSDDQKDGNLQHQLEVAAGTPVVLNYLLTHPITCTIQ